MVLCAFSVVLGRGGCVLAWCRGCLAVLCGAGVVWGRVQWSSTRGDLFPEPLCDALASLQDRAPVHSFRYTRRALRRSFRKPPEDLFLSLEAAPLASGSVAQVHRGTLRSATPGLSPDVAVKVSGPLPPPKARTPSQRRLTNAAEKTLETKP